MRAAMLLVLGLVLCGGAVADPLYRASTIVTGTDGRSRPGGLRQTLGQVLAKVGGDPALATDPRVAGLDPAPLVQGFAYLDRMSDIPKHDEQGSRDRPFDLVVQFDPAGIDAVLRGWGRAPWPLPRPVLVVQIEIVPRRGAAMMLRADTFDDERHRAALLAAADRFGVEVVLPADGVAVPAGGPVLTGTLRWSEADAGWNGRWSMRGMAWGVTGVGFDAAYRDAVGGAVKRLSGAER